MSTNALAVWRHLYDTAEIDDFDRLVPRSTPAERAAVMGRCSGHRWRGENELRRAGVVRRVGHGDNNENIWEVVHRPPVCHSVARGRATLTPLLPLPQPSPGASPGAGPVRSDTAIVARHTLRQHAHLVHLAKALVVLTFTAREPGWCVACNDPINRGDVVMMSRAATGRRVHATPYCTAEHAPMVERC